MSGHKTRTYERCTLHFMLCPPKKWAWYIRPLLLYVALYVVPTQEVGLGIKAKPILWRDWKDTGHVVRIVFHLFSSCVCCVNCIYLDTYLSLRLLVLSQGSLVSYKRLTQIWRTSPHLLWWQQSTRSFPHCEPPHWWQQSGLHLSGVP